jgi:hypothetical protein
VTYLSAGADRRVTDEIPMTSYLEQFLRCLPKQADHDYETRRGTPGITFKLSVKQYYVTVSVTGTDGPELPSEVASALALWSLETLASKSGQPKGS